MNLKKEVKILKEDLTEKEIQLRNKTILDSFFDEYARPPKKTEFVKIGGILNYLQQQTGFELFLKDNGYICLMEEDIRKLLKFIRMMIKKRYFLLD